MTCFTALLNIVTIYLVRFHVTATIILEVNMVDVSIWFPGPSRSHFISKDKLNNIPYDTSFNMALHPLVFFVSNGTSSQGQVESKKRIRYVSSVQLLSSCLNSDGHV